MSARKGSKTAAETKQKEVQTQEEVVMEAPSLDLTADELNMIWSAVENMDIKVNQIPQIMSLQQKLRMLYAQQSQQG